MNQNNFTILLGLAVAFVGVENTAYAFGKKRSDPPQPPVSGAPIGINEVVLGGSGCPGGSATFDVFREQGQLRVNFSEMTAEVEADRSSTRKTCSLAVSVDASEGHRVTLNQVHLVGHSHLGGASQALISHESFVAGQLGQPVQKRLAAGSGTDQPTVLLLDQNEVSTECGVGGIFRTNSSIRVQGSPDGRELGSNISIHEMQMSFSLELCE